MTADVDRVRLELQRAQHAQTAPLMMAVANATSIGLLGALEWIRHPGPPVRGLDVREHLQQFGHPPGRSNKPVEGGDEGRIVIHDRIMA